MLVFGHGVHYLGFPMWSKAILSISLRIWVQYLSFSHPQLQQKYKEVDFLIPPNKIIEHNGTYDHADSRIYSSDSKIRATTAENIWKREKRILDSLKKENYKILVIWQHELDKDTENTAKKILKFVKT